MLTTFTNLTSLSKLVQSSEIYKFYDTSNNELELFAGTTGYSSITTLPGGGTGINADGSKMFIGRISNSANTSLIHYSYDGGLTWNNATHQAITAVGCLYFKDGTICIASNSSSASAIPFMVDTVGGFTNNLSFSTLVNGLSAGCRAVAVGNNTTASSGYSYQAYQSFFRCTLGTGLNPNSAVTTLANHGNASDLDVDPDDPRYFMSSSATGSGLSVNSVETGGKTNITTGLSLVITSVATSSKCVNSVIQTSSGTYRISDLSYTTGARTMTTLSDGVILPVNCGTGPIGFQSCKASMSYNGNVICVIDMNNTPIGKAYYSVDGGLTFKCINTEFGLSNKTFISCCVSRGPFNGVSNTNYILLLSSAGVYRMTFVNQY